MNKHLHNSLRALFLSLAVLLSLPMLAEQVEIGGINYDLNAETNQATVKANSVGVSLRYRFSYTRMKGIGSLANPMQAIRRASKLGTDGSNRTTMPISFLIG